jgi:hypothetical protein
MATSNKTNKSGKTRKPDTSELTDESLVSTRFIAELASLTSGHLRYLRRKGKFIEPVRETKTSWRFEWGQAREWLKGRKSKK